MMRTFDAEDPNVQQELAQHEQELNERLNEVEALYEKKFQVFKARYRELKEKYDDAVLANETLVEGLKRDYDDRIKHLEARIAAQESDYSEEKQLRDEYVEYLKAKYEHVLDQAESEHDTILCKLQGENQRLKTEGSTHVRKLNDFQQVIALKREVEILRKEKERQGLEFLQQQADAEKSFQTRMRREADRLTSKVNELERALQEKETEQLNMQAQLRLVEQSRKVLQHQLQEARNESGPRSDQLNALEEQVKEFDLNREKNLTYINELKYQITECKRKVKSLRVEMKRARDSLLDAKRREAMICQELTNVVTNSDPETQSEALLQLYAKVAPETSDMERVEITKIDDQVHNEVQRQRATLHRVVDGANKKVARAITQLRDQKQRSIIENAELLHENKKLRKELTSISQAYERTQGELRRMRMHGDAIADAERRRSVAKRNSVTAKIEGVRRVVAAAKRGSISSKSTGRQSRVKNETAEEKSGKVSVTGVANSDGPSNAKLGKPDGFYTGMCKSVKMSTKSIGSSSTA